MNTDQLGMLLNDECDVQEAWVQLHHFVVDRGSKYSATGGRVESAEGIKAFVKKVKKDKKYAKATHNIFAARVVEDGKIVERKSDDGETGAGMVILRLLRQHNLINVCVVVTRWYGGVHLNADRFKHVQDGTQLMVECVTK
jgi:putative IMPACT (imprinted ancient) family translation regulator